MKNKRQTLKKSIFHLVRKIHESNLAKKENTEVNLGYSAFEKLKGIGGWDNDDASKTIDELLYGEKKAIYSSRDKLSLSKREL